MRHASLLVNAVIWLIAVIGFLVALARGDDTMPWFLAVLLGHVLVKVELISLRQRSPEARGGD